MRSTHLSTRTPGRRRLARLAAPVLAGTLLLAGCGGGSDDEAADDSRPFNDADIAFATDMIPHHAQALVMVDLLRKHDVDPAVSDLAEQISAAQTPEIETMADWLQEWGEPVPATQRDHAHGDEGGMGGMDMGDAMPGMMSDDELDELAHAPDAEFQDLWLQMMIEHHEGAIEMAETEISDGEYADAVALAKDVRDGQQAEVEQMQQLLGG
jgi:uncharacterized protein (DUF305 family)